MDTAPADGKSDGLAQPEAEVLAPRAEGEAGSDGATTKTPLESGADGKPAHRRPYRPSHRGTFIGIAVVASILLVNAVIIGILINSQTKSSQPPTGQVTINDATLNRLGVNSDATGSSGVTLTIAPDTNFKGQVQIGGNISVAGKFSLNSKFTANDADLGQLEAGNTTLSQLNVNGNSTLSNVSLRDNLVVTGTTWLQGPTTLSQLLTVNNSVNVGGNLSVSSTIAASAINSSVVTAVSTLTIGGHVVTAGSVPSIVAGSSAVLGSNGTVSISGNDAAGTIAFNVGAGASSGGLVASLTFRTHYAAAPHVVVSPIGDIATSFYIMRTSTGFSFYVDGKLNPGGYAIDYIVEQ